ncbi:MAG: GGDEF domain-containing protein [Candidatus Gastranaerophilales bacterium]|nr:GGDEF domain-containing protein [Candidatus Gastranaerophilales bacterium]
MKNLPVKKIVHITYVILMAIVGILLCYIALTFSISIQERGSRGGYEIVTDYVEETVVDDQAPAGVRKIFTWTVQNVGDDYRELIFYGNHQSVEIYLNDECIYTMRPDEGNAFGHTPGHIWNLIMLSDEDNGKELRLELIPAYETAIEKIPVFYFGAKYDIMIHMLGRSAPSLLFGVVTVIFGLAFIGFVLLNYKNSEIDKSLVMLGLFSIELGIWKFTDVEGAKFLFPNQIVMSLLPLLELTLVSVPFVLFIKEQNRNRDSLLWYVPCLTSFVEIAVVVVLQLAHVMDIRQTLFLTHMQLFFLVISCAFMVFLEVRESGWSKKLKLTVFCMVMCFAGMLLDLAIYYVTNGAGLKLLAMCGFLIYIIVQGITSMNEARQLMAIGMRAKNFERMAYHDQLTGLYNRNAYAAFVDNMDFDPEHCIVVMFDLNDLKKCNDTLGHEKGDLYIKESARIIQNIFGEIGDCYRMGGDEFCVVIKNGVLKQCKQMVGKMQEQVNRFNASGQGVFMQIACGYELYDKRIDYNISDTARRADKMMYHEKFSMKQKNGGGEIR